MTNTYRIVHTTEYRYESQVSSSYGEAHLLPREVPGQRCLSRAMTIDPAPHDLRQRADFFGNRASFFTILAPHLELSVTATSVVAVDRSAGDPSLFDDVPWESARDLGRDDPEVVDFALDSPLVTATPALAALAAPAFSPGRPVLEAVADLSGTIHRDFTYDTGATTVTTTLGEVLEHRAGVCQDFAHLLIGALAVDRARRPLRERLPRDGCQRPARSGSQGPTARTPGCRCGCRRRAGSTSIPPTTGSSAIATSPPVGGVTTGTSPR